MRSIVCPARAAIYFFTIILLTGSAVAEELIIGVTHRARGPKGTMCNLVGKDGKPVGQKVIVRSFFFEDARKSEVHYLKVTSNGESMPIRSSDGTSEDLPIFHFVEEVEANADMANAPGAPNTERNEKEAYRVMGGDAAILIPAGWNVTTGLPDPLLLVLESGRNDLGVSVLRESPDGLGVSNLKEYTDLKRTMLMQSFADYKPSDPKSGKIEETSAFFFSGPGTVENVNGTVSCTTIAGKDHYYLFLGVIAKGSSPAANSDLMKLIRSFKEKK